MKSLYSWFVVFFSLLIARILRLISRTFGGNFGIIPSGLPEPTVQTVLTASGNVEVLCWNMDVEQGYVGHPLVLLHGLNANAWIWSRTAGLLIQKEGWNRPIVAISMPGHGNTFIPQDTMTITDTTETIVQVLDALQLREVDLAGHSWGGKIAMVIASNQRHRIHSLILCDPVPPQGVCPIPFLTHFVVRMAFLPERKLFNTPEAFQMGSKQILHLGWCKEGEDKMDQHLWDNMFSNKNGVYSPRLSERTFWDIVDHALAQNVTEQIAKIHCPVLLCNPNMTVAPWPGALRFLRRLPKIQEEFVSGDHCHMYTNPQDMVAAIAKFFKQSFPNETPYLGVPISVDDLQITEVQAAEIAPPVDGTLPCVAYTEAAQPRTQSVPPPDLGTGVEPVAFRKGIRYSL